MSYYGTEVSIDGGTGTNTLVLARRRRSISAMSTRPRAIPPTSRNFQNVDAQRSRRPCRSPVHPRPNIDHRRRRQRHHRRRRRRRRHHRRRRQRYGLLLRHAKTSIDGGTGANTLLLRTASPSISATSTSDHGRRHAVGQFPERRRVGAVVGGIDHGFVGANTITGGSGTTRIDGAGGADVIAAGAGDDTVTYRGTESSIDGGSGSDTLVLAATGGVTAVNLSVAAGVDQTTGDTVSDHEFRKSRRLASQPRRLTVTGSSAANTITTGSGNDTIDGGGGADVINAGGGNDTVSYYGSEVVDRRRCRHQHPGAACGHDRQSGKCRPDRPATRRPSPISRTWMRRVVVRPCRSPARRAPTPSPAARAPIPSTAPAAPTSSPPAAATTRSSITAPKARSTAAPASTRWSSPRRAASPRSISAVAAGVDQTAGDTVDVTNFENLDASASVRRLTVTGSSAATRSRPDPATTSSTAAAAPTSSAAGAGDDTVIVYGVGGVDRRRHRQQYPDPESGSDRQSRPTPTRPPAIPPRSRTSRTSMRRRYRPTRRSGHVWRQYRSPAAPVTTSSMAWVARTSSAAVAATTPSPITARKPHRRRRRHQHAVLMNARRPSTWATPTRPRATPSASPTSRTSMRRRCLQRSRSRARSSANTITAGSGNDTIDGAGGADVIKPRRGNDTVTYRGSKVSIDGGAGIRHADSGRVRRQPRAVNFAVAAGSDQTTGDIVSVTNFENLDACALNYGPDRHRLVLGQHHHDRLRQRHHRRRWRHRRHQRRRAATTASPITVRKRRSTAAPATTRW